MFKDEEITKRMMRPLVKNHPNIHATCVEDKHASIHIDGAIMESGLPPTEEEYEGIIAKLEHRYPTELKDVSLNELPLCQVQSDEMEFRKINGSLYYVKKDFNDIEELG